MRPLPVMMLLTAVLFFPAPNPRPAARAASAAQARPSPSGAAEVAAATHWEYRLKEIKWSYSSLAPSSWKESDIVARGSSIGLQNPFTTDTASLIKVTLNLPEVTGNRFHTDFLFQSDPPWGNVQYMVWLTAGSPEKHERWILHPDLTKLPPAEPLSLGVSTDWVRGSGSTLWAVTDTASPGFNDGTTVKTSTQGTPPQWPQVIRIYWLGKMLTAAPIWEYVELPDVNVSFAEPPRMFQVSEAQLGLIGGNPVGVKAVITSNGQTGEFAVHAWFSDKPAFILTEFAELAPENIDSYGLISTEKTKLKFDVPGTKTIYFCRDWPAPLTGSLEAWVELDPGAALPETNREDNVSQAILQVWQTRWPKEANDKLRLVDFSLDTADISNSDANFLVIHFLPLGPNQLSNQYDNSPYQESPTASIPEGSPDSGAAGIRMTNQQFYDFYMSTCKNVLRNNPGAFRLVGSLPYDWFSAGPAPESLRNRQGFSITGGRLVLKIAPLDNHIIYQLMSAVARVREIGHSLGLPYAGQGQSGWVMDGLEAESLDWAGPSQPCLPRIMRSGTRNALGESLIFPSYMAELSNFLQGSWTRGADWNALLTTWGLPTVGRTPSAPLAGEVVQISGSVAASGSGQLDSGYRIPEGTADSPAAGEYTLALANGAGQYLYSLSFPVSFTPDWAAGGTLDRVPFTFILPWQAGTARIVLRRGGVELASRTVSSNAPTVRVISPNGGGALSGQQTISWTAGDLDGDPLLYTVQYTPDGGAHWILLGLDLQATSLNWDTSLAPGGTDGRIRVTACDGVNTGSDMSDTGFSLANHPPSAIIILPVDGNTFLQGHEVLLQGEGRDLEDGALGDDRLTWRSDRDGLLGNGQELTVKTLSVGRHLLTLSVRDSQSAEASASKSVNIVAGGQPDVRLTTGDIGFWPDPPVVRQAAGLVVNAANIVTGTLCNFDFFDGNPAAGGTLIETQKAYVEPDLPKSVIAAWQPMTTGSHTIFVRASGCNPPEADTTNNTASRTVVVAQPPAGKIYLPLIIR